MAAQSNPNNNNQQGNNPQNAANTPQAQSIPTQGQTPPANMPPTPILNQNQQNQPNQAAPPQAPQANVSNQTVTTAGGGGRRFPKKILFALLGLILVGAIGALVVGVVLPRLGTTIPGQGGEIVWWGLWEDDSIVTPIIEEYEQQNPGVTIVYERRSKENYRERLANEMARGTAPDIFRIHNTWVPMFRNQLATLPSSVMSASEFQSTFYPVAVDDLSTTNGIVAIPLEYDGLGLFINEEIFTTYGATIPRTWNELRSTARSLTIKDSNDVIQQSGVALGITENVDHWEDILGLMLIQNGADLTELNDEQTERALLFYKQFSDTDEIWDRTLPQSTVAFAAGKVAMIFGPSWRAFEVMEQNPGIDFRVVSVPQLPSEDPNAEEITYATYWAEAVWDKSEVKEEAWKFLKYLSSKDVLTRLYENSSKQRPFGEPYSRQDMRDLLLSDPVVGGFVELAPTAKSWYLADRTFDGETGLNTTLAGYFEDAINARRMSLGTLSTGARTVLSKYGLAAPVPTPEN